MSRQVYKYCKVQCKVVPVDEVIDSEASLHIINDEMPPTRNPLNSKEIFTSKSKLRAAYRAAGVEEVGTAYENGYNPHKEKLREIESRNKAEFKRKFREYLNS